MEYNVKITQFEGPLDLLLHLVSKAEIAIEDIFVSDVTDQYLRYMENMDDTDMDVMSDFLNMASLLIYIKSRAMLPVVQTAEESDENPELELIEKLKLYKAYKEASGQLRELENEAENIYFKYPEELPDLVSSVTWEDAEAGLLYKAYMDLVRNRKQRKELFKKVSVKRDVYSVHVQSRKILSMVKAGSKLSFSSIFEEAHEPLEIAVTFLALLQLWRDRKVSVSQSSQFSEIYITKEQD